MGGMGPKGVGMDGRSEILRLDGRSIKDQIVIMKGGYFLHLRLACHFPLLVSAFDSRQSSFLPSFFHLLLYPLYFLFSPSSYASLLDFSLALSQSALFPWLSCSSFLHTSSDWSLLPFRTTHFEQADGGNHVFIGRKWRHHLKGFAIQDCQRRSSPQVRMPSLVREIKVRTPTPLLVARGQSN